MALGLSSSCRQGMMIAPLGSARKGFVSGKSAGNA
jgi:hypothetical protein